MLSKEIILTHDGDEWIAGAGSMTFRGKELDDIDNQIKRHITNTLEPKKGSSYTFTFCFDNSVIPEWIRQYSNHYFNRKLELKF